MFKIIKNYVKHEVWEFFEFFSIFLELYLFEENSSTIEHFIIFMKIMKKL